MIYISRGILLYFAKRYIIMTIMGYEMKGGFKRCLGTFKKSDMNTTKIEVFKNFLITNVTQKN